MVPARPPSRRLASSGRCSPRRRRLAFCLPPWPRAPATARRRKEPLHVGGPSAARSRASSGSPPPSPGWSPRPRPPGPTGCPAASSPASATSPRPCPRPRPAPDGPDSARRLQPGEGRLAGCVRGPIAAVAGAVPWRRRSSSRSGYPVQRHYLRTATRIHLRHPGPERRLRLGDAALRRAHRDHQHPPVPALRHRPLQPRRVRRRRAAARRLRRPRHLPRLAPPARPGPLRLRRRQPRPHRTRQAPLSPTARWTEGPGATVILRKPPTVVFKLTPP